MDKLIKKGSYGEYVIGGIYKHYKGNFYMIDDLSFLHDSQNIYLISYHQVNENGVFISVRNEDIPIHQPWCTHETRWNDVVRIEGDLKIIRFVFIK